MSSYKTGDKSLYKNILLLADKRVIVQ